MEYRIMSHPEHLLKEHLNGVANIGIELLKSYGISDDKMYKIVRIIGMCHDFGKCNYYFQQKLKDGSKNRLANHGLSSALFAVWLLTEELNMGEYALIAYLVIKRHHGNIGNSKDEIKIEEHELAEVIESLQSINKEDIDELNRIYDEFNIDICKFLNWLNMSNIRVLKRLDMKKDKTIDTYSKLNLLYSILLTGDKMHLIGSNNCNLSPINKNNQPSHIVDKYKDELVDKLITKNKDIDNNKFFKARQDVYSELVRSLEDTHKNSIFSINVPTGTGKTILGYKAALYLNNKQETSGQIIYCLPFTSVIDQNYEVLKAIIERGGAKVDDSILLKYHSLTPLEYRLDCDKSISDMDGRFCSENWQSGIICTTFIQLFDTLFKSSKNSIGNRYHRLTNSIIILDEIQCINPIYFEIIENMLKFMVDNYNIKILLISATMPLLFDTNEKTELIPNKKSYFNQMDRIEILNYSKDCTTLKEFKETILYDINKNRDKSYLAVLNTIKSSKEVYEYLKENCKGREVIYLSTEIYPKLRLELIDKIRSGKEKYIVVSTQLVEAGVDIDMDIVYRDFAPLDSINQVCGRANRNDLNGKGMVKLYKLIDDYGNLYCNYIYPTVLLNTTSELLDGLNIIKESDIFKLSNSYFEKVRASMSGKNKQQANEIAVSIADLSLAKLREDFQLIENKDFGRDDFVICIDEDCRNIINKLIKNKGKKTKTENLFRELRNYMISAQEVNKEGKVRYINIDEIKLKVVYENGYNIDRSVGAIGLVRE